MSQPLPVIDQILFCIMLFSVSSALSIALYGHDKKAAVTKNRRISEDTFHILALLGGWPGALYAQKAFCHKTKKVSFRAVFWVTVWLNVAGVIYSFTPHAQTYIQRLTGFT
ncbi:DUF1294 domain-containing protein [Kordiimonas pumila]|uniref:DUF1294 domain-containing protein n=1 Tax=Kordiimonas pumila TaxID=2161677 RepID=A0ABV7D774_9PROT|nr:DUF1294 domain-containing protein [Kordiimonas pumila]